MFIIPEAPALSSALFSKAPWCSAAVCWQGGALSLPWFAPPGPPHTTLCKALQYVQIFHSSWIFTITIYLQTIIDGFGQFYFVSVEFEWSVSICAHFFWSEMLCSSATSAGSECRIYHLLIIKFSGVLSKKKYLCYVFVIKQIQDIYMSDTY